MKDLCVKSDGTRVNFFPGTTEPDWVDAGGLLRKRDKEWFYENSDSACRVYMNPYLIYPHPYLAYIHIAYEER